MAYTTLSFTQYNNSINFCRKLQGFCGKKIRAYSLITPKQIFADFSSSQGDEIRNVP